MSGVDQYVGLITGARRTPKFRAFVEAVCGPLCDAQAILRDIRGTFDLDTAVGVQLDAIGQWVGRTRYLEGPLAGVYFSWDESGVGWGEGVWKGPYDPSTGLTMLQDDLYRRLPKAKIAAILWRGNVPDAFAGWAAAFAPVLGTPDPYSGKAAYGSAADTGAVIIIQDNQDMSMSIGIAGIPLDSVFRAMLLGGYIPLKPEGVRIEWYAVTEDGGPLFAWNCDGDGLAGWGEGGWPAVLHPSP